MWRSVMFVPVLEQRFITGAAERGADAIALDLEASIPADRKAEARSALAGVVQQLAPRVEVTVRINAMWLEAVRDLEACAIENVSTLHLARCESAQQVSAVDSLLTELEAECGLASGSIALLPFIESPGAVLNAESIAHASTRICGLTMGVEDYAMEIGVDATDTLLRPAGHQVILAARSANVAALVVPTAMSDFRNLEKLENAAQYARTLGSTGGFAVHPGQVGVLNQVFSPNQEEIDWAKRVIGAAESAVRNGKGVFLVDGKMIDEPIIKRARRIIEAES